MTTQKEQLYYCKLCGRHNFVRRAAHRPPPGVAGMSCKGDFTEQSPANCFNCNFQVTRACPDASVITRAPWGGCQAWSRLPAVSVPSVPSVVKAVPATIPTLNDGHDQATAKELLKRFNDAQTGLRRVVAFGLLAWEVKEQKLKHGQFGTWLAAHCPKLTSIDSATGKAKPSNTLTTYMGLTRGVLVSTGFTIEKYLNHVSNSPHRGICHSGKYLLVADKKLPEEVRNLKEKICSLVDGRTQRQLLLEFKQVEEDASGNVRSKRGRLKGQGGASKQQRILKAAADAALAKAAVEIQTKATIKWLKANCVDDLIGTKLSDSTLQAFNDWCKVGFDYSSRILSARQHKS